MHLYVLLLARLPLYLLPKLCRAKAVPCTVVPSTAPRTLMTFLLLLLPLLEQHCFFSGTNSCVPSASTTGALMMLSHVRQHRLTRAPFPLQSASSVPACWARSSLQYNKQSWSPVLARSVGCTMHEECSAAMEQKLLRQTCSAMPCQKVQFFSL